MRALITAAIFFLFPSLVYAQYPDNFTFIGMTDTNSVYTTQSVIATKAKALKPAFVIFTGDTDNSGANATTINTWATAMSPVMSITFPVRGNHDTVRSGSLNAWNTALSLATTATTVGATHYASLSGYEDAVYSFDYGNSHFIGLDVPGNATTITSSIINWLDTDLNAATARSLTHAFIYFHGPIYCMGSSHCTCTTRVCYETGTIMQQLYSVLNKYPLVTATFHGHEHHFSYVYVDSTRIPPITHPFYQFVMGTSGGSYRSSNVNRFDYTYIGSSSVSGLVSISVNGPTITVNWLLNGDSPPAHTFSFTKTGVPPTPTPRPHDYDRDGDVDFIDLKIFFPRISTIFNFNSIFSVLF